MERLPHKIVNIDRLPKNGVEVRLEVNGEILDVIAREIAVLEVLDFEADFKIMPWKSDGASLQGRVVATIAQECVVSLDAIEARLDFEIDRQFVRSNDPLLAAIKFEEGEMILSATEDLPDALPDGKLDLWSVVAEELDLQVDPFPRKEGVAPGNHTEFEESGEGDVVRKPFAGLDELISKKNPQVD